MKKSIYEVNYWTPENSHSTAHTHTDRIEAESLSEAVEISIKEILYRGKFTMYGFDTTDSFGGVDRDHYSVEDYGSPKEFEKKVRSMLEGVKKV